MKPKHERFDFSKEKDQAEFSALDKTGQEEIVHLQQDEANLLEGKMGHIFARLMVSADLYAAAGDTEKARAIFERIATERRQHIETYDEHTTSLIANIAEYLASDEYRPESHTVIRGFSFGDIKLVAAFLGREIIETSEEHKLEIGACDGKTYFLRHNGEIIETSQQNSTQGIYDLTDNNKHH